MLTPRTQPRILPIPKLRHTNCTPIHRHTQQFQLQLDSPVLRHPSPNELDTTYGRAMRTTGRFAAVVGGTDDVFDEKQIL